MYTICEENVHLFTTLEMAYPHSKTHPTLFVNISNFMRKVVNLIFCI